MYNIYINILSLIKKGIIVKIKIKKAMRQINKYQWSNTNVREIKLKIFFICSMES